jgi:hypothetical protein
MPAPTDYLNEQETLIADDFRNNVGKVFQELHGDRWDESLWKRSIGAHYKDIADVSMNNCDQHALSLDTLPT